MNIYTMNIVNVEKKLVDKLIYECTEPIEEVKLAKITPENENKNKYSSCRVYIELMIVVLTIFTGINIYFVLLQIGFWLRITFQRFGECNSIEWTYK